MNLTFQNLARGDQTLGLMPIECGWGDPNCLGGYSSILGSRDAAMEPLGSRWGYDIAPTLQPLPSPFAIDESSDVVSLPATPTQQTAATQNTTQNATTSNGTNADTGAVTVSILGHQIDRNIVVGVAVLGLAYLLVKK
jgi:hypothetical protein